MIWVLGIIFALVIGLYLIAPFLSRDVTVTESEEVMSYREELKALEKSQDPDPAKKAALQASLLKAAKADPPRQTVPSKGLSAGVILCLIGATAGIYAAIGSPNFTPETRQAAPVAAEAGTENFQTLIPQYEALLAENPEDAKGWYLYGRILMLSGDSEAGLRAYERSLELNDSPDIQKEYAAAKRFAARDLTVPTPEDIEVMQSLSAEDRNSVIESMVESLRVRLETDPTDTQGWIRLLRSRKVLDQMEQGKADIETIRNVLPDEADDIIAQSGWAE